MSALAILASVFGIAMGAANIPQAYKIFKRKSGKDISLLTYSLLTIGSIVWLIYGIALGEMPIILTYIVGTCSCVAVTAGSIIYR
jgi:MtN3 and saliva related transmembrane protein